MNLKRLCRLNSVVIILCYFLPFIPPMCESGKKSNSSSVDSTSVQIDTIDTADTLAVEDSLSIPQESPVTDTASIPEPVIEKSFNVFEFLASPDGESLSGVGYIYYYTLWGISVITLPASLVLLILSLMMKRTSVKWILVSTGFGCLLCFGALSFEDLLYGYWITLLFYCSLTLLYWRINKKEKYGG
ncbi:MAG: hypothetical protein ACJ75J_01380 [Cytophagaceae bacterium]